jgi:hypothetical protein
MMPVINEVMLAVSSSLAASIVAKATVTTALSLAGVRLARRSRAAVRHALMAAAFGVLLALPVASVVAPPVLIPVSAVAQERNHAHFARVATVLSAPPLRPNVGVPSAIPQPEGFSLSTLLLTVWIAGATLFLLPVLIGLWQVRRLRRSALPWPHGQLVVERLALEAGIHRRVEVLLHEVLQGPMTCGALHPTIVLPQDAQTWTSDDLNRALVHELEHVRRSDWVHSRSRTVLRRRGVGMFGGHCLRRSTGAASPAIVHDCENAAAGDGEPRRPGNARRRSARQRAATRPRGDAPGGARMRRRGSVGGHHVASQSGRRAANRQYRR